jgi:hypothetical protein
MENLVHNAIATCRRPAYLEWLRYISAYLVLTYGTRKLIGGGQFALGPALMINIFFHIALGAEIAAAFLLGSTMLLLWQEREGIIRLFWRDQSSETRMENRTQEVALAIVVLLVLAQVFVFAKYAAR